MRICDANVFLQCFLSELTALAIPSFFFISGLLFFHNLQSFTDILAKWKRRLKSLLLPFFCWNVIVLVILVLMSLNTICRKQLVTTYSFALDLRWIMARLSIKPIVGQFWYIRTLMLFCLLAPICLLFFRNIIASIVVIFVLRFYWSPVDCGVLSSEGMFWFFLGGFVGYRGWQSMLFKLQPAWWGMFLVVSANILLSIFHCKWNFISWEVRIILSVYLLMQCSSFLVNCPKISNMICFLGKHAFFIYALHAILLSLPELVLAKMLPHTPWNSFLCYWGCVAAAMVVSVGFSCLLRRFVPRMAALLNGYR